MLSTSPHLNFFCPRPLPPKKHAEEDCADAATTGVGDAHGTHAEVRRGEQGRRTSRKPSAWERGRIVETVFDNQDAIYHI